MTDREHDPAALARLDQSEAAMRELAAAMRDLAECALRATQLLNDLSELFLASVAEQMLEEAEMAVGLRERPRRRWWQCR